MFALYHILNNFISKFYMVIWRFIGWQSKRTGKYVHTVLTVCIIVWRILNKVSLKFSISTLSWKAINTKVRLLLFHTRYLRAMNIHWHSWCSICVDLNCMYNIYQCSMLMHSSVPVHVRKWFQFIVFFFSFFTFPARKTQSIFETKMRNRIWPTVQIAN